jgi:FAD/FMN-containing dehydrogenase
MLVDGRFVLGALHSNEHRDAHRTGALRRTLVAGLRARPGADDFERAVRIRVDEVAPRARVVCFGHLGDGNLHVNVLGLPPDDFEVDDAALTLVAAMGGSISAEHGIGIAKRAALERSGNPADIAAMRAIKLALDPLGILNPGVLVAP